MVLKRAASFADAWWANLQLSGPDGDMARAYRDARQEHAFRMRGSLEAYRSVGVRLGVHEVEARRLAENFARMHSLSLPRGRRFLQRTKDAGVK